MVLLLLLSSWLVVDGGKWSQLCPSYYAKRTNNGKDHFCLCSFQLCPGDIVSIDGCIRNQGQQVLYLLNNRNSVVNSSLQFPKLCGGGGQISNIQPVFSSDLCQTFKVKEGCRGMKLCKGTVVIRISNDQQSLTSSKTYQDLRKRAIIAHKPLLATSIPKVTKYLKQVLKYRFYRDNTGGDSSFGYCSTAQEFTFIEIFLICLVGIFIMILCSVGIVPLFVAILRACLYPRYEHRIVQHGRYPRTAPVTQLSDSDVDNVENCS